MDIYGQTNERLGYDGKNIAQIPAINQFQLNRNPAYEEYMRRMSIPNNSNQSQMYLKCRPVSSKEQARAFQIDLDGSLWVFTDVGNGKIYTKQISNNGIAIFRTYALVQDQPSLDNTNQFVTKEEFNKVIQTIMSFLPEKQQEQPKKQTQSLPLNFV